MIEAYSESNSASNSESKRQSKRQSKSDSRNRERSNQPGTIEPTATGNNRSGKQEQKQQAKREQQPQPGTIKPTATGNDRSGKQQQQQKQQAKREQQPHPGTIKPTATGKNRTNRNRERSTNWGGKIGGKKKYQPEQALSIENFDTLDSTKDEHIVAFDDTNPSLCIFAKVSRKFAKRHMTSKNNIKVLRKFAPEIVGAKPTVPRGHKCGSINDDYAIIGIRPERLSSNNGVYVFKSHVKPNMKLELEETTVGIVKHMHHSLTDVEPFVGDEMDVLSQILSRMQLNAIG
eukprot:jgi/Psemu1/39830/gm1.39830_g